MEGWINSTMSWMNYMMRRFWINLFCSVFCATILKSVLATSIWKARWSSSRTFTGKTFKLQIEFWQLNELTAESELNEFFDEDWTGPTVRWESWMSFTMRIERVLQYGERVEWVFRWGLNGSYSTVRELNGFLDEDWTGPIVRWESWMGFSMRVERVL